jgi:hypothetical protein
MSNAVKHRFRPVNRRIASAEDLRFAKDDKRLLKAISLGRQANKCLSGFP